MDLMETAQLAPEITSPPPEFADLADDFPPPPPEMADIAEGITPPPEEFTHKTEQTSEKKTSLYKRLRKLLYGSAAAVLSIAVAAGSGVFSLTPAIVPTTVQSNQTDNTNIQNSPQNSPDQNNLIVPQNNVTPVLEPDPSYPLADGIIYITVYNNSFDMSAANDPLFPYTKVLLHKELPEAEWQDITLPEPASAGDNFAAHGYVLHDGSPFDFGSDTSKWYSKISKENLGFTGFSGKSYTLNGNTLAKKDVEKIAPAEDGSRYINVHVIWMSKAEDQQIKLPLELDFGDHKELIDADTPYASEGFFYLSALKVEGRDGKTFTGWFDAEGNKVDFISYYDFFPLLDDATNNEDRDWSNPATIKLTAKYE